MYNKILTTDQLIEEMKKFKWTRFPKELHKHHTWKPTHHSFDVAVKNNGKPKAYTVMNDSMRNYHIKVYGGTNIAQHLTLFPDGMWAVGRDWNTMPISISNRNATAFAIEMIGNFDVKGLSTTEENTLGYDIYHGSPQEAEFVKFAKFFFEFFKLNPATALTPHSKHSTKTCPGNGIVMTTVLNKILDITTPVVKKKYKVVNAERLNVRNNPGVSGTTVIGTLSRGTIVESTETRMVSNLTWHYISTGWVSGYYLEEVIEIVKPVEKVLGKMKVVNTPFLNVRNNPGTTGTTIVGTIKLDEIIEYYETRKIGSYNWYRFEKGWASGYYLEEVKPEPPFQLKLGDRNQDVAKLQLLINDMNLVKPPLVSDGSFGNLTQTAVRTVQRHFKLPETGIVDKELFALIENYEVPVIKEEEKETNTVIGKFRVNTTSLNVRNNPGTAGTKVVGTVALNTIITPTEVRKVGSYNWYKIEKGWVSGYYLVEVKDAPAPITPPPSPAASSTDLRTGSRGAKVLEMQKMLNADGFALKEDSSFGTASTNAVKGFQRRYGLPQTGIVNKTTWDTMVSKTAGKQPIYRELRMHSTNIKAITLSQKDYHVDFEVGIKGKHERPSVMANNLRAQGKDVIATVNLGFFVFGSAVEHLGTYVDDGVFYNNPNPDFPDLIYHKSGKMEIVNHTWFDRNAISAMKDKVYWVAGLSYGLLIDGKVNILNGDKFSFTNQRHPRTLIGQKANGDIVLVAADGRTANSLGLTAKQSADVMKALGCVLAINADGGGSTMLGIYDGVSVKVVNRPSDKGVERAVGSALMVYKK